MCNGWSNAVTDYFTIINGVKQGGVLLPILFSLGLDLFISQLKHVGMDCHMNCFFTIFYWHYEDKYWLLSWNSVGVIG